MTEEAKQRRREQNKERMRKVRARLRENSPPKPPKPPKEPRKVMTAEERRAKQAERNRKKYLARKLKALLDKRPKAQNIVIENKQQAIDKKRAHLKAVVVWPENVKVQVVPGFQGDTRYKPGPGYVGGFTQEWNERRAA